MKITFPFYLSKSRDQNRADLPIRWSISQFSFQKAPALALSRLVLGEHGWRHARISVQGSDGMYCTPRGTHEYHHYDEFEVGFPDLGSTLFGAGDSSGVYGYVAKENIQEYIDNHGGIVGYYDDKGQLVKMELNDEDITYYSLK